LIEDVSKMSLTGFFIAEVRNNIDPDNEGKIGVFIPQLMYENEYNEKPYEKEINISLNKNLIINSNDFENLDLNLEESNYILARPLSYYEDNDPNWKYENKFYNAGSLRIPRIGSQVIVIFFNEDLQKCYYLPFSPNVENNKINEFNCIDTKNYNDSEKRANIDVIRFYWDGTRIEVDTNNHTIKLATPNKNYIKISNDNIEIKGNVHIKGELEVDNKVKFKSTLEVTDLVTCHNTLEVQDISYFYGGQIVNGSIINNKRNLTLHTHNYDNGSTSTPN